MKHARALLLAAATTAMSDAGARDIDPSTYLLLPTVTQDERELDFRFGDGSVGQNIPSEWDAGLGFGLGVTERWFTEFAVQYRAPSATGAGWDSLEWENILQVSEQGEWPVDVGIAIEIDKPRLSNVGTTVYVGPLLQKDLGRIQLNLNVLANRQIQSPQYREMHWTYQFQAKYSYAEALEFGVQGFGSPGSTSRAFVSYEDQTHRVGPVVLGKISLGSERALQYNTAFLLGMTSRSPARTLRLQLEYEF
jgi:hypothetical protein